jgi:hypothetical protein
MTSEGELGLDVLRDKGSLGASVQECVGLNGLVRGRVFQEYGNYWQTGRWASDREAVGLIQGLQFWLVLQTYKSVMLIFAFTARKAGVTIGHVVSFSEASEALLGVNQVGSPVFDGELEELRANSVQVSLA